MNFILNLIKNIIFLLLLILAFLGFKSIGGVDLIKGYIESQNTPQATYAKIQQIADFSEVPPTYQVLKAIDTMGIKAAISINKTTGQKMIVADQPWMLKLTKNDIRSKMIENKINDISSKFSMPPLKLSAVEVTKKGWFKMEDQNVPYANIKVNLGNNGKFKDVDGIIAVAETKYGTNKILISLNDVNKYSQKDAENYFKSVKIK